MHHDQHRRIFATTPTDPEELHIAYWLLQGWRHVGLGLFKSKQGHMARLYVYSDGSTGMRALGETEPF